MAPLMRLSLFLSQTFETRPKSLLYGSWQRCSFAILMFYPTIHESFYLFMLPNMLLGACLGMILPYIETYAMEHLQKERLDDPDCLVRFGFMLIGIILARHLEEYTNGLHYLLLAISLTAFLPYWLTQNNTHLRAQSIKGNFISYLKVFVAESFSDASQFWRIL